MTDQFDWDMFRKVLDKVGMDNLWWRCDGKDYRITDALFDLHHENERLQKEITALWDKMATHGHRGLEK